MAELLQSRPRSSGHSNSDNMRNLSSNLINNFVSNNYNEIIPNLYLGNKITPQKALVLGRNVDFGLMNVKRVLTVMDEPICWSVKDVKITYMHVQAYDDVGQALLPHFEATFEFIDEGLMRNEGVYVHCRGGISRSATIVIAYLMKKLRINHIEAQYIVKEKRYRIWPNDAFNKQLSIYNQMGYKLDVFSRLYRDCLMECFYFNLNRVSSVSKDVRFKSLMQTFWKQLNVENHDDKDQVGEKLMKEYGCRICGSDLFNELNVIANRSVGKMMTDNNGITKMVPFDDVKYKCNVRYIEPLKWMEKKGVIVMSECDQGFIKCPACLLIIGQIKYTAFICPCPQHDGLPCLILQLNDKFVKVKSNAMCLSQ